MKPWPWVLFALPRHARDNVLADLLEEAAAAPTQRGAAWVTWQVIGIAWDYLRADLLQPGTAQALALGICGFVLLHLALAPASQSLVAAAAALGLEWHGVLATLWGAPAAMAALTAGIAIGMIQQPSGAHGEAWRWLAVVVGAFVSAATQTLIDAGLQAVPPAGDPPGPAVHPLVSLIALAVATRHRHHLESING